MVNEDLRFNRNNPPHIAPEFWNTAREQFFQSRPTRLRTLPLTQDDWDEIIQLSVKAHRAASKAPIYSVAMWQRIYAQIARDAHKAQLERYGVRK